eukprot:snap_masked-scaffold548_size139981-processed-gene-0.5 protein:Tk08555 transcript:snap_masked-scaffold548_size139981-processed-gene-0.5-mRNA-1 annotation:"tp53-regulating kinase"
MDAGAGDSLSLYRQGAEGRLYRGHYVGQPVLIKHRFAKRYRHPQLDERLSRERLKGEVRSLIRCQALGIRTPTLYLADLERSIIVMEFLAQAVTCRDFVRGLMAAEGPTGGRRLWALATRIGAILGRLHGHNLIHGDLTTSNILVANPEAGDEVALELVLIDFGLGSAEGSSEDKGVDLYVLERAWLSTHPNTEHLFEAILTTYRSALPPACRAEVLKKFEEIRLRGRKRTMLG